MLQLIQPIGRTVMLRLASVWLAVLIALGTVSGRPETIYAESDTLDGRTEINLEALASLAAERAQLGALWLARNIRSTGKFNYIYDPVRNRYDNSQYNPVRHAGVTYALFEAYGAFGNEEVRASAEHGARYLLESSPVLENGQRAFVSAGRTKLGSQALAIVALLERRRATGDTEYDPHVRALAEFMIAMEIVDAPGRYFQSYNAVTGELLLTPDSDYYPGEALLALVRLDQQFPDGPYREAARRAADYLVHVRDGDIPAINAVPREDHWLTIALSELYLVMPEPTYARVAYLQAQSMLDHQYRPTDENVWAIGSSRLRNPVNYTSTATKGEALNATRRLAAARGDLDFEPLVANGAARTAQFLMRVQYTADQSSPFPDHSRLVGAWGQDIVKPYVRMDFVQHSVAALIGVWRRNAEGS